jgi:mono/diheme cytochrome c family protein
VRWAGLVALALAGAACGGAHAPAGRRLFVSAGCGHCHALRDAGTRGGAGPDFDTSERLDRAQILQGMVEGANGMPSYAHRLTVREREALAGYLLRVGWRRDRAHAAATNLK